MKRSLCAVLTLWILVFPRSIYPCGPYFRVAKFVSPQPEDRMSYFGGNLGILRKTYSPVNLLVAWRVLDGKPLSDAEKQALIGPREPTNAASPVSTWLAIRDSVPGGSHIPYLA